MVLNDGKTTADGLILFYTFTQQKKKKLFSFLFESFVLLYCAQYILVVSYLYKKYSYEMLVLFHVLSTYESTC